MTIVQCEENFAKRVLSLRDRIRRSREYFEVNFNFSPATIRKWEALDNPSYKVNVNKLKEYLTLYEKYFGINVSLDWVLYGRGEEPILAKNMLLTTNSVASLLFNELPLFFFVNIDMVVGNINPKYASLLSTKPLNELENKHLSQIMLKETYDDFAHILNHVIESGKNDYFTFLTHSETQPKILINCQPVFNNQKEKIGVFNFIEGFYK